MGMYGQRLLDNNYVQENLAQAAESLRAAYHRASKRRVEPTRDEKLRRQVREAARSFAEAASALKADLQKPKRKRGQTSASWTTRCHRYARARTKRRVFYSLRFLQALGSPPQSRFFTIASTRGSVIPNRLPTSWVSQSPARSRGSDRAAAGISSSSCCHRSWSPFEH